MNLSATQPFGVKGSIPFSQDNLFATLNYVDVVLFTLSLPDGRMINFNEKLCSDLRKTPEQIYNQRYADIFWDDFVQHLGGLIQKSSFDAPVSSIYYWAERNIWGQLSLRKVLTAEKIPIAIVSVTNITEISKSEYEYRRMAFYDQQLNIPNGRQLELDVKTLASYENVALIHFDIDHFGSLNEVFGWDSGDCLLEQIRDWMLATAVKGCKLYRISEDEFAALITGISLETAKSRARSILDRFKLPWMAASKNSLQLFCTVTMGIVYGEYLQGDIRNQLFRTISRAEQSGEITLYNAEMDAQKKEELLLRQTLVNSLQESKRGFSVCYQPIVNPHTGFWVGAEALCRWSDPAFGNVSPEVFIPLLEQIDLISELDDWVLETALRECAALGLAEKNFLLDINHSPLQLVDDAYIHMLVKKLDDLHYPHNKLCMEITESKQYNFSTANLTALEHLREHGIYLSLDDFGTGYSSFENLIHLPAQFLKIEKSFIQSLETDSYQQYLLRAMVDLAHAASLRVIAEGVETQAQKELLVSYGVDFIQGYLYARPLTGAQLANKLSMYQG